MDIIGQMASDRPETHIFQTFLQFSSGNLAISAGIHLVEPVRGPRPATWQSQHLPAQKSGRNSWLGDGRMASKIMPPANKIFIVSYYIIPNPIRGSFFFGGDLA